MDKGWLGTHLQAWSREIVLPNPLSLGVHILPIHNLLLVIHSPPGFHNEPLLHSSTSYIHLQAKLQAFHRYTDHINPVPAGPLIARSFCLILLSAFAFMYSQVIYGLIVTPWVGRMMAFTEHFVLITSGGH